MRADRFPASTGFAPLGSLHQVMVALAGRARREILIALIHRPRFVSELAHWLCVEVSQVSEDLGILYAVGAVVFAAEGRFRFYRPGPSLVYRYRRGGLVVHCRAECGSLVALNMTPRHLAEVQSSVGLNGQAPASPPVSVRIRRGSPRRASRRTSEPG